MSRCQASGTAVILILAESNPGGTSVWAGSYVSAAGKPEGEYAWASTATECADGAMLLAADILGVYVVDDA